MSAIDLQSTASQDELDYCRNVERELADFAAYFRGGERFDAVDSAVLNFVRMRVAILSEHIDHIDASGSAAPAVLDALQAANCACCDFLINWAPQPIPIH